MRRHSIDLAGLTVLQSIIDRPHTLSGTRMILGDNEPATEAGQQRASPMSTSLDIEQTNQLLDYLRESGHISSDEVPRITNLTGGVSNRTVLVERSGGDDWVLKQALAKLRVQVDWFSPPERVHREAFGLRWLDKLAPPGTITPIVFEDFEHHLIAMQAVPEPHQNWKNVLLTGDVRFDHIEQFATLLGTIHTRSHQQRVEVEPIFADRGYFESLRLEPYYGYTATQVPEATRFLEDLMIETRSHTDTIVHGDYSPKNVLIHHDRLILLDHEVIHYGDPCFDVGFSMTHFLSKAHHLPDYRPDLSSAANRYWATYWKMVNTESWTTGLECRAIRHTLGCLLARVRGRSPLEYLDSAERKLQAASVIALMRHPPETMSELIAQFTDLIARTD
ncbi:aminoglycoside phosphotransferase family protein [soil metagenome]